MILVHCLLLSSRWTSILYSILRCRCFKAILLCLFAEQTSSWPSHSMCPSLSRSQSVFARLVLILMKVFLARRTRSPCLSWSIHLLSLSEHRRLQIDYLFWRQDGLDQWWLVWFSFCYYEFFEGQAYWHRSKSFLQLTVVDYWLLSHSQVWWLISSWRLLRNRYCWTVQSSKCQSQSNSLSMCQVISGTQSRTLWIAKYHPISLLQSSFQSQTCQ